MQSETFATIEHTSTFSTGVLQAWRRFTANCGDHVVRISDHRDRLRLLLDVLNLDLLLLLLLLGLLLSCGGGGIGLLLGLSLCLCLRVKLILS